MNFKFLLNGKIVSTNVPPEKRLLDVLREEFAIASLRRGCGTGSCGICTVLMDEEPVPSCMIPMFKLSASDIMTEEGLKERGVYQTLEQAFRAAGATPCDYCRPSTMLIASSILERNTNPKESDIIDAFIERSCSCTDLESIIKVIKSAGRIIKGHAYA